MKRTISKTVYEEDARGKVRAAKRYAAFVAESGRILAWSRLKGRAVALDDAAFGRAWAILSTNGPPENSGYGWARHWGKKRCVRPSA